MKRLYLCGRYRSGEPPDVVWDFQGVFASEQKAIKACRDKTYFVGPIELNKSLPHETVEWPNIYYPLG